VIDAVKDRLAGFDLATGTVHFTVDHLRAPPDPNKTTTPRRGLTPGRLHR
jgi:hypothetical protein